MDLFMEDLLFYGKGIDETLIALSCQFIYSTDKYANRPPRN